MINAATENKNSGKISAVFCASPTNLDLARGLEWDYDPGELSVPVFFVSGTGDGDENLLVSGAQLREIYDRVPAGVPKLMARRTGADHGDMLYFADGYMTAWFLWQLRGDAEAAACFLGDSPELASNPLYQDQRLDLEPAEKPEP